MDQKSDGRARVTTIDPEQCQTLKEVRDGVDELDNMLLNLLVRRQAYTVRAAQIKKEAGMEVRDPNRIEQQVTRAKALGAEKGLSPLIVEPLFRVMIEQHIEFETIEHGR